MFRPLLRLSYFSCNLLRGPHWRVAEQIDDLLTAARIRNAHLRITGALLFNDGCFAQILEGEAEDVNWLFDAIALDRRHCNVTLLQRAEATERAFPDWAMHYVETVPVLPPPGAALGETLFQRLATVVHGGM